MQSQTIQDDKEGDWSIRHPALEDRECFITNKGLYNLVDSKQQFNFHQAIQIVNNKLKYSRINIW